MRFPCPLWGRVRVGGDAALVPLQPILHQAPQYVALAVIFASLDCLVMLAYAMLGSRAVRLLKTSGTLWLERLCGAALLALAGFLAFYRRASA